MFNVIIIPARLESKRLPNKLLLNKTGYPLLWHTIQRAFESKKANKIIVATQDEEIIESVIDYNRIKCLINKVIVAKTVPCDSGTERLAYVAESLNEDDLIVNLQGDEPELPGRYIDQLFDDLNDSMQLTTKDQVITLVDYANTEEKYSENVVKAVLRHDHSVMYFSREPIPFKGQSYKHIGIYAYSCKFLRNLHKLPQINHSLKFEKLEQLQWLQAGITIKSRFVETDIHAGIDTQEEYDQFVKRCVEII